jgi:hypothetical protein
MELSTNPGTLKKVKNVTTFAIITPGILIASKWLTKVPAITPNRPAIERQRPTPPKKVDFLDRAPSITYLLDSEEFACIKPSTQKTNHFRVASPKPPP